MLARRAARARAAGPGTPGGTGPGPAAEIDALLATVGTGGPELALRLSTRLGPLVQRGVPPRWLEAAPVPHAARLHFADGTTLLVKGAAGGDIGVLAVAMSRRSVQTVACTTGPEGNTNLFFRGPRGRHGLWLQVVGLDQPD